MQNHYNYIFRYVENAKSWSTTCNTAGCGKLIYFDKRFLNPVTKKQVQLESAYIEGQLKPKRHYCIKNQYISKDEVIKSTPPNEEVLGHLLIYKDENNIYNRNTKEIKFHCDVCKRNWFWFTNYY